MRLHRLEITAIGPFAGTEVVDLDQLAGDGLFLLHGDTGAGKTTVLDAIAFALFGRVPGARQQAGRLRCDHAAADLAPAVTLELTLAGRRLRVTRSPAWIRPRRRGPGTTPEPASAVLSEWDGRRWVGRSTRIEEVSQQLQDWIGMSAEQFFQVVLLPQGDFARFLRAESVEREELLERLFGTHRFTEVQDWLAQRRRDAAIALEATESEVRLLLHRLAQAAGIDRGDEPAPERAGPSWREELVASLRAADAAAASAEERAAAGAAGAAAAAERARSRSRLRTRLVSVLVQQAELEAEEPAQRRRCQQLKRGRHAAVVRPQLQSLAGARLTAEQAELRLTSALAALGGGEQLSGSDHRDLAALRTLEATLRGDCGRLAELLPQVQEHRRCLRSAAEFQALAETARAAGAAARAERAELPVRIGQLRAELAAAEQEQHLLPVLEAEIARLRAAHAAATDAVGLDAQVALARAELARLTEDHLGATARVLELREQRLRGMAAELAGDLRADCPCPVCGALEHPAPARGGSHQVSVAEEESAARAEARAGAVRSEMEQLLRQASAEHAELLGRCGGVSPADLAGSLAQAQRRRTAAADAAQAVHGLAAELRISVRQFDEVAGTIEFCARNEGESATAATHLLGQAAQIADRLDAARAGDLDVGRRLHRLQRLVTGVEVAIAAHAEFDSAFRALARAGAEASATAVEAGFDDLDAAAQAALGDDELAALAEQTAGWEQQRAAVEAQLGDPELADPEIWALAAGAAIDLAAAEAESQIRQQEHTAAVAELAAARARLGGVRRLAAALTSAEQAAEPARRHHAEVRDLADLVAGAGQNSRSMTLRAYILGARLSEVALSASVRLQQMSDGRYSFEHTAEADSRRVRAGLGLVVRDDYSGRTRSTKTLSGGESFMASLALALGLADVVTAESGGTELETLFIDEGFGGLDAASLDMVMDTLDELRSGGRVVGVVSHVEDMRLRIPSQLHVRKRREGSTLEQRSA